MDQNESLLELEVDHETATQMTEFAKWAKLLSMLAFAMFGIMLLIAILFRKGIATAFLTSGEIQRGSDQMLTFVILFVVLLIGGIGGVLFHYLYKGATRIRKGIEQNDQQLFNNGLDHLRKYFAMYGVITIIGLVMSFFALF